MDGPCTRAGGRRCLRRPVTAALILLVALIWRLWGIGSTEVWRDEAITILHTRAGWWELLTGLWFVEDSPPAGFLLFKAWSIVSEQETWFRLLSVGLGVLTVAVLMRTAERIRPGAGLATGLLAALAPLHTHFSQEIRGYALAVLLTACCLALAVELCRGAWSAPRVAALAVCGALAAWTHVVGLFVYPCVCLYLVIQSGRPAVRQLLRAPGVWFWLILVLPLIPFSLRWTALHHEHGWWLGELTWVQLVHTCEEFLGITPIARWVDAANMERMWLGFAAERVVVVAVTGLLLAACLHRRFNRQALGLVAAALMYGLCLLVTSWAALPNFMDRTLLPAWCPVVLALGLGACALRNRARVLGAAAVLALVLLWIAGWGWVLGTDVARRPANEAAYAWIRQQLGPGDLVFSAPEWMEDLSAYRLGDRLRGGQFLTQCYPAYEGLPATHRMTWRGRDPEWQARFGRQLNELALRTSDGYSVWIVRFGTAGTGQDDSPDRILAANHAVHGVYRSERTRVWVVQYRPRR